jgi:hypothetical protein
LRKYRVVFLCWALMWPIGPLFAAQNAVGQAVQRLHLSPQQLLSLRDFLGPFNRGTDADASEDGLFVLRDAATMAYAGEFSLRVSSGGRLDVDRIDGHARLDPSRAVLLPLRLTDKARAQAVMTLANSGAARSGDPVTAEKMAGIEPPPALPAVSIAAATLVDAAAAAGLAQSRAEFWPDGSGWSASVRVQPNAPTMRMTERFFAPIRGDAIHAWRDRAVEISGDTKVGFADLEKRYACAASAACVARYVPAENGLHVIRWNKALIAAVPAPLLAQIAVPLAVAPVAPAPTPAPAQENEAAPGDGTASPASSADNVPENPNGL